MIKRKDLTNICYISITTFIILLVLHNYGVIRSEHNKETEQSLPTRGKIEKINDPIDNHFQAPKISGNIQVNIYNPLIQETVKNDEKKPQKVIETSNTISLNDIKSASKTSSKQVSEKYIGSHNVYKTKNICEPDVNKKYRTADQSNTANSDWCQNAKRQHGVVIGRSWGSLSKGQKKQWDEKKCNELIKIGKLQSCDESYGWKFFEQWKASNITSVTGNSHLSCITNLKTSSFCQFQNVIVDFSKLHVVGSSRGFSNGFLTTYGNLIKHVEAVLPGIHHKQMSTLSYNLSSHCDYIETRPTFVLSNDDIFNLGHYINDVMNIWNMIVIANKDSKQSLLINIDGLRAGGPAGGGAHRLMVSSSPDSHGPYINYYYSWFDEVKKGIEYKNKKVCFKNIYFPPVPGIAWFWNDWGIVNTCAVQSSSPLYQSFNLFLRQRWINQFGYQSLVYANNNDNKIHIVIEVRAINPKKANNHSSARHIKNLDALVKGLSSIRGVRVTAQDFAKISFDQQVALSHSASIFISMHGAGTTHIFHMPIGSPNCCALIELQPDHSIGFQSAHGYGNLARMLGLYYYRYEAAMGSTGSKGTTVSVATVVGMAKEAVLAKQTFQANVIPKFDCKSSLPSNLWETVEQIDLGEASPLCDADEEDTNNPLLIAAAVENERGFDIEVNAIQSSRNNNYDNSEQEEEENDNHDDNNDEKIRSDDNNNSNDEEEEEEVTTAVAATAIRVVESASSGGDNRRKRNIVPNTLVGDVKKENIAKDNNCNDII
eukprot:gene9462-12748_t